MFRESDFSDRQLELVRCRDRRVLVDAGAGSGKTRTLISRIVSLLEDPSCWRSFGEPSLHRIVAITFTEKAALEMKTRLRSEFRDRARAPEIRDTRVDWAELEREVENARISTIHSFCAGLLRQHALLLGINPDTRVLDATETGLLFAEFMEDALSRALDDGDPDARGLCSEFGTAGVGRLLRELMEQRVRVIRLLDGMAECLSDADQFAAFLRDSRPVMLQLLDHLKLGRRFRRYERILREKLIPLQTRGDVPAVIHSKTRCIQKFFDAVRERPDTIPAVLSSYAEDWKSAGRFITKELGIYLDIKEIINELHEYVKEFMFLRDGDGTAEQWIPEAARLTASLGRLFRRVASDWQFLKASRNTMDFDDLIVAVRDYLRENERFRTLVRKDIRFLLVDEQQDTDPIQMEIFDLLCEGEDGPDLFMVGDANQSIYRFRGADVSVFVRQKERPGTTAPTLLENYRCQGAVLAFINAFFEQTGLLQQYGPYRPLEIRRVALPGPAVEVYVTPQEDENHRSLTALERASQEADFIAERILHWMELEDTAEYSPSAASGGSFQFGDFAILLRQGTHAGIFEEALRRRGIPATVHVGATFYRQQEIFDCAALARLALNGSDEAALVQVSRSPFVGLSDDDLLRLRMAALETDQSLAEYFHSGQVPANMDHPDRLAWGRHLYRTLSSSRHMDAGAFFRKLFAWTEAETLALGWPHGFQIRANLRKMARVAESFSGSGRTGLRAFVEGLDQFIRTGADEGEANLHGGQVNAVRILSIHKAKGLEFPVVFLPQTGVQTKVIGNVLLWHPETGLVLAPEAQRYEKDFFSYQRIIKAREELDDQAEMERLLYVAMTRARDRLVLCVPEKARSNSWSEPLCEFLALTNRQDGEIIEGADWQVRIWRSIPKRRTISGRDAAETTPAVSLPQEDSVPTGRAAMVLARKEQIPVISVTRLLNLMGTRERDEDEDRPEEFTPVTSGDEIMLSGKRRQAVRRGTLVHRFFELWQDFWGNPPDPDRLFRELRVAPAFREPLRDALRDIARLFAASALRDRLARDKGAWREYPFYYRLDSVVIRGTLDWLGSDGLILDYKTGHITAEKLERYRTQLALYAAAVRQVLGMTRVEGALYFTDTGQVEWVDLNEALVAEVMARVRNTVARYVTSPAD